MMLIGMPVHDCVNESDVEQKFLFPLLTHGSFLGIAPKNVLTKRSLGTLSFVEKSSLPKNYIPDYVVFMSGLPICVVEAKAPDVAGQVAIGEARLYANALNAHFPSGLNPVALAVGCNGVRLLVGPADSNNEQEEFACAELLIGSSALETLRGLVGPLRLADLAGRAKRSTREQRFTKPATQLGRQFFLERMPPNALAGYLTPLYEMFFRAEDPEKTDLILDRAYVDSAQIREYDRVLHSMLRQIERAQQGQPIHTDKNHEYTLTPEIERYQSSSGAQGRLHLIIGARGSGKSLFIARFFAHLIPAPLKDRSAWCVIDFNRAPASMHNVEEYICDRFVETVQNVGFDHFSAEGLTRVFSVELSRLRRGPLSRLPVEHERVRAETSELMALSKDKRAFAVGLARHLVGERDRPLIVVFDNVDRRESSQQLQIFQAAQWFRNSTRAFALLTLRDLTYERYKGEPPLDAFAQISNFYIRAPRFSLVLQKRLDLALQEGLSQVGDIEQRTESGLRFRYGAEQLAVFLQAVYDALFAGNQPVGRVIDALAERDVRSALGMFARIIASGHFNADRIIGIGTGGDPRIGNDLLVKILMRADYKFYSEGAGYIHNIFWAPDKAFSGNIFLTAEVLAFFVHDRAGGSDRLAGYWRVEELLSDSAATGFEEDEVRACLQQLLAWKLLAFDGEYTDTPNDADRVMITPAGFIHLKVLPGFIEYLAAVALHAPVGDPAVARRITGAWDRAAAHPDLDFPRKHDVAEALVDYLVRDKTRLDNVNPLFRERSRAAESVVRAAIDAVNQSRPIADRIRSNRVARRSGGASSRKAPRGRPPG